MFRYEDLLEEVAEFSRRGVETGEIGKSVLGRSIPYVFIGDKTKPCLIVQGAIHAREHITALLVVCQAKYLLKNSHLKLLGGVYFLPMTNPDGVKLCQEGVGFLKNKQLKSNLIAINRGKTDFSLWKANVNGVDLNTNFDACWGEGERNVFCKASENYVGKQPFCEPESQALRDFTLQVSPVCTLSYHAKGEQIFWRFCQDQESLAVHRRLAEGLANQTGYQLVSGEGSCGGYKDWCIQTLKIPAFTLEVGNDKFSHPFPYKQFDNVYFPNEDIPRRLLNSVVTIDQTESRSLQK